MIPGGTLASSIVTNLAQIADPALQSSNGSYSFQLEGNIWWSRPAQGRIVLQDATDAVELELALAYNAAIRPGERVRLEGNGTLIRSGAAFKLGARGPVVDNNGVHDLAEKSGAVYLTPGLHPLRLDWFNGVDKFGLEVEFEGPDLPKQKIPDAMLFRESVEQTFLSAGSGDFPVARRNTGLESPVNQQTGMSAPHGLDFRCYEVPGEILPELDALTPVRSGVTTNFDLSIRVRDDHVGLRFEGFFQVPRGGLYTFYLRSDDGSRLFIGDPAAWRLTVIGQGNPPEPRPLAIGQTLRENEDGQWARVEGKVIFVREEPDGLELELGWGSARMRVEIADKSRLNVERLLRSTIRATGFCESAITADGHRIPGILLVPGVDQIEWLPGPEDKAGDIAASTNALPVLHSAVEVHRLKREEAERGYPVRFRGVVTSVLPEHQAFTIQDATRGLYVEDWSDNRSRPPRIGELLEIDGSTDPSKFAPIVKARRVTSVSAGHLPEPVRPAWDQLMNGSLDAQFVEIEGIVTAVQPDGVTVLTRGGVVNVELRVTGVTSAELGRYENALVRIRGTLLASWDYLTHQVRAGRIRIFGADVVVDEPAPGDLFSRPGKTLAELLLFDPQAGAFERVKVAGQIVGAREPEFFVTDGQHGVRFMAKVPDGLAIGDQVEVVGFPDLFGGAAPVLREAVVRKTGHAALPEARRLAADDLIRAEHDSTRVRVQGKLVSQRRSRADETLELQNGVRTFVARWNATNATAESLPIGSQLELTGIYVARGGNRVAGENIASFELLLGSPLDVKVLARPPWWTLGRLLVIVGVLAAVLAATMLWITQLHRQVTERTAQLGAQIQERQRVEHQHAMEQERARIAQDLHDELGSGITEISMLAARAKSASAVDNKRSGYLEQVGDKAREMVTALDEIVWAMNPRHDSLASLVTYFCLYADRFLGLAGIAWRLDDALAPPDHAMDSRQRHQLFLAFKEALTNIVRHSGATEVRLSFRVTDGHVRLTIMDNGRGLPASAPTGEMDGMANMRARVEKLGGHFEMDSEAGCGTTLRLFVPANGE